MLRKTFSPYGYKNLLVYKKSEELQKHCSLLTSSFPPLKILFSLSDQMNRSARSVKQNIVEGWKRNSTSEYHEFLGFSIAANTELEEDCDDIIKGVYPDLMGIKGVTGEMGVRGEEKGVMGEMGTPSAPSPHFPPSTPFSLSEIEKLPFYPLNPHLPPVVQLKLRAKELNYLLSQLQKSLESKMRKEKTLTAADKLSQINSQKNKEEKFAAELRRKHSLIDPYA